MAPELLNVLKDIYQELVISNCITKEEKQIQRQIFRLENEIRLYDPDDENVRWKYCATELRMYKEFVNEQGCKSLFVIKDEENWED